MPTVQLTPEEVEIFKVGQSFARLQNSDAYKKQLEWMDELVDAARREHEAGMLAPECPIDVRNNLGIRYVERRLFRELIARNVAEIVNSAKFLAQQIQQEEKGTLNGDTSGNTDDLG